MVRLSGQYELNFKHPDRSTNPDYGHLLDNNPISPATYGHVHYRAIDFFYQCCVFLAP